MTTRQFNFSFSVGIALAALGAVILSKAAVGLSLIALGAIISALALTSRITGRKTANSLSAAPSVGHFQGSAR